jgi:hypothetical protein
MILCQPAKIAERSLLGEVDGANRALESTLANRYADDQSPQGTVSESPSRNAENQCRDIGDQPTRTGTAAIVDGVDLAGGPQEHRQKNETETSVAAAIQPDCCKFTTGKTSTKLAASGITHSTISKHFVRDAISPSTGENSSAQPAQSVEKSTSQEAELPAALANAGKNLCEEPVSDSIESQLRLSSALSAESNSDCVAVDTNTAETSASEEPGQQSRGDTEPSIGEPETFWAASRTILLECRHILKPGGWAVFVCKNFVRNKQIVPFCDDWCKLLESCGFTVERRIHAMLVKETTHTDLFGVEQTKRKERKSFFRRLAEKKGSPPIDFEEVIFARRLLTRR